MNAFDDYINRYINPQSVGAGVGTVFLSFFTGKLAPKLPDRFYKLLDNTLVRVLAIGYLINQQIRQPSMSVIISTIMVLGFEVLVKVFAPDSPSLSELVKTTTGAEEESGKSGKDGCNCYCAHTIHTRTPPTNAELHKFDQTIGSWKK